ncbi:disease resistance protein [Striga asiatica]|uniref:Disease resistance protein n=1 Tax=Striga asiatica TaxID=4170 RepID=A0A5A7QZC9_STRAF|nr:disease resistance protein [Striga asiatica]
MVKNHSRRWHPDDKKRRLTVAVTSDGGFRQWSSEVGARWTDGLTQASLVKMMLEGRQSQPNAANGCIIGEGGASDSPEEGSGAATWMASTGRHSAMSSSVIVRSDVGAGGKLVSARREVTMSAALVWCHLEVRGQRRESRVGCSRSDRRRSLRSAVEARLTVVMAMVGDSGLAVVATEVGGLGLGHGDGSSSVSEACQAPAVASKLTGSGEDVSLARQFVFCPELRSALAREVGPTT